MSVDYVGFEDWDDDSDWEDKVRVISFRRARQERRKAREEKRNGVVPVQG